MKAATAGMVANGNRLPQTHSLPPSTENLNLSVAASAPGPPAAGAVNEQRRWEEPLGGLEGQCLKCDGGGPRATLGLRERPPLRGWGVVGWRSQGHRWLAAMPALGALPLDSLHVTSALLKACIFFFRIPT